MIVVDNVDELKKIIHSALDEYFSSHAESSSCISGWPAIESYLGIGKAQIRQNERDGLYGDALQHHGRQVILNTSRLWDVLHERENV